MCENENADKPTPHPSPADPDFATNSGRLAAICPLIIIAAIFLAHLPALDAPFLFDDYRYFVHEPAIRSLALPWRFMAGTTRPLLFLSLAIDHAVYGMSARGFHLSNILILCLSSLTLFGIVRRTLLRIELFGGRTAGMALIAALAWGVHPLQTNLTCYVWQRGEMLMGFFYLATLYCFVRGVDARATGRQRAWYWLSILACLLGMGSKEVMVTAPLMVLLYDRAFAAGSFGRPLRARAGFYAGMVAVWAVFFALVRLNAASFHGNVGVGFHSVIYSPVQYVLTMPGVLAHYLRLVFVPVGLCFDPNWPIAVSTADVLVPFVLVGPLLALTCWALAYYPRWAYGGAWFFVILAPSSSFMPMPDPLFEYRLHLSLAGVLVLVTASLSAIKGTGTFFANNMYSLTQILQKRFLIPLLMPSLLIIAMGIATHCRCRDYGTEAGLWADTFAKRPNNIRAFSNLWLALKKQGGLGDAEQRYARLAQDSPRRTDATFFLGYSALQRNDLPAAQKWFERTLQLDPAAFMAVFHLGEIAGKHGRAKSAAEYYLHALRLRPLFVQADVALGKLFEHAGEFGPALRHYERAIRLAPKWGEPYAYKGRVFLRQGRVREAVRLIREAVKHQPESLELRQWLQEAERMQQSRGND